MTKESRRRQRTTGQTGSPGPTGQTGGTGQPGGTGATRAERRRGASAAQPSFLERYRTLIVAIGVIGVVGLVGIGLFSAATSPVYACSTEWTPDATQPPVTGATPQPGYVQPDMGQGHVSNGTSITYTYCPPASGKHYNGTQTGPVAARVYGPDDAVPPQGWIHNLEHGAMVVLYRGDGDGATDAGQSALKAFFDSYPPSPVCGFAPGTSVGPVFVRFDDMATPFAAMVWGRVLPLETLDTAAILELDRSYGERTNPESFCARPTPTPAATDEPSATASPS